MAAFQNEGAWNIDGKGESIWDRYNHTKGKIKDGSNADMACDFYHRYKEDIGYAKELRFGHFRTSISWSRIFPNGIGEKNQKGIDYYHLLFDACLELGIDPMVTLYHWDLPQALEDRGGWINRDILNWFSEYADFVSLEYGDKVKNWCVLNEPLGFIGLGYVQGLHAPGYKKIGNFFPGVLHAALCQAEGGRILRENVANGYLGTTHSCSYIDLYRKNEKDKEAAKRLDALFNRMLIEPLYGLGFPEDTLPVLKRMDKFKKPGDDEKLIFDFDFIGLQYYFRFVGKHSLLMPSIHAREVKPEKRDVPMSTMNWEIFPEGLYFVLKKFSKYPIPEILVTENGCCFPDKVEDGHIHDNQRVQYFIDHLSQLLRAKKEGINVNGYFAWTLTDNFEWNEGYDARFGIVFTDFNSQQRFIKDSGYWFRDFLKA